MTEPKLIPKGLRSFVQYDIENSMFTGFEIKETQVRAPFKRIPTYETHYFLRIYVEGKKLATSTCSYRSMEMLKDRALETFGNLVKADLVALDGALFGRKAWEIWGSIYLPSEFFSGDSGLERSLPEFEILKDKISETKDVFFYEGDREELTK